VFADHAAISQNNCPHEDAQHNLPVSEDYLKSVQTQTDDNQFTCQTNKKMHHPDAQGDGINVGQQIRKFSHVDQVHGDGDCKQDDADIDEFAEKNSAENQTRLLDWDLKAVETPIENGEWIAFLQKSMEEIMEGDIDSMLQQNCVSVFVSPLRNPAANCRVIEYVACLLALPFTVSISQTNLKKIEKVYLDVRVVPNLIYAIKLLMLKCPDNESYSADKVNNATIRSASSLSADELQALERVLLVVCRLVYIEDQFLMQFCNAIYIVNGVPFLQELLSLEKRKTRIVMDLIAILNNVLRSQPENAELVERVVLRTKTPGEPINKLINIESLSYDSLQYRNIMNLSETWLYMFVEGSLVKQLCKFFNHRQATLRARTCIMTRLLGRFCCRALQQVWNRSLKNIIEGLTNDEDKNVRDVSRPLTEPLLFRCEFSIIRYKLFQAAKDAVAELKQLTYYNQKSPAN